jgi:hypothetical protein
MDLPAVERRAQQERVRVVEVQGLPARCTRFDGNFQRLERNYFVPSPEYLAERGDGSCWCADLQRCAIEVATKSLSDRELGAFELTNDCAADFDSQAVHVWIRRDLAGQEHRLRGTILDSLQVSAPVDLGVVRVNLDDAIPAPHSPRGLSRCQPFGLEVPQDRQVALRRHMATNHDGVVTVNRIESCFGVWAEVARFRDATRGHIVLPRKLPDGDARGLRDGHFGVTRAQSVMAIGTCA